MSGGQLGWTCQRNNFTFILAPPHALCWHLLTVLLSAAHWAGDPGEADLRERGQGEDGHLPGDDDDNDDDDDDDDDKLPGHRRLPAPRAHLVDRDTEAGARADGE